MVGHGKVSRDTMEFIMKTKPIVAWPGGKTRLVKHLSRHLKPHTCYCEPFCGGLGFFLNKPPSKVEVINVLLSLRGGFLLTVNDCLENRRIFACFQLRSVSRQRGIANKTADQRRDYRELIIVPGNDVSGRLMAA